MNTGGINTKSLDEMAAEQLRLLAAGTLDVEGQQLAGTILAERIRRLGNTVTAFSKHGSVSV